MNTDPTQPPSPRPRWLIWLAGIVIGDMAVGLQYGVAMLLMKQLTFPGRLGLPSLFLVPALGGLIASYIWRTLRPSITFTILNTLWMTLLALIIGTVAFREGAICLLILSPLFFASAL